MDGSGITIYRALRRAESTGRLSPPVTLEQMVTALLAAMENPTHGIRVVSVPEVRSAIALKPLPVAEFGSLRSPCYFADQSNRSNYQSA
jgi:hypothetical protein